ncbi:hypothetical protein K438DRAFT_1961337 [Mycena galopus ATCC 62051]|nr:hypothetical protein K438DRAFT_1961337 [Mycena galopus ATCC 62051]
MAQPRRRGVGIITRDTCQHPDMPTIFDQFVVDHHRRRIASGSTSSPFIISLTISMLSSSPLAYPLSCPCELSELGRNDPPCLSYDREHLVPAPFHYLIEATKAKDNLHSSHLGAIIGGLVVLGLIGGGVAMILARRKRAGARCPHRRGPGATGGMMSEYRDDPAALGEYDPHPPPMGRFGEQYYVEGKCDGRE